ncbi:MAG: cyclic nucleotide-binding domain-containing protein [Thermodesulfobacteriota bacterium]
MATTADLRKINILQDLPEAVLTKIAPLVKETSYKENDIIFRHGELADSFGMLLRGKILLNVEAAPGVVVSLGSIKAGYSFGWGVLIPGSTHRNDAVALEPCLVLLISGEDLLSLMDRDRDTGYHLLKRFTTILKNRLDRRTSQFVLAMGQQVQVEELAE